MMEKEMNEQSSLPPQQVAADRSSSTISFPEPDGVLAMKPSLKKYLGYLAFFGPGAVLVSITIGQGQLILGPQIGGWAGFHLLWLITLNIGSYIIAYIGCRFTMLSGIGMMDMFALKTRRGWLNWLFILIMLVFIPLFAATIITTLGQSLQWIFGIGHYLYWGISFCLLAAVLVLMGRYKLLEYTQAFFVAVLGIGAVLSVAIIRPDILGMLPHFFLIGDVPSYPPWVDLIEGFTKTPIPLLILGYLGTLTVTIVPLVGYLGWMKVKRWGVFKGKKDPEGFSRERLELFKRHGSISYLPDDDREVRKAKTLLKPLFYDLCIAFILVSIISAAYMTAGKYLLGPQADGTYLLPSDINLIREQAIIFSHMASWLEPLFKVSVVFALFGTVYAGFEGVSRMMYEAGKGMSKKIAGTSYRRFVTVLLVYILSTSIPLAILMSLGLSVLLILSITLLFIGVVGVIMYGIGAVYMSHTLLPERYRPTKPLLALGIIGIMLLVIPFIFLFI
jgi:Mn2+/Fe2+ NRAMP family transporter